ncbi:MAG: O-antigen ligase family protein [Anaerolineae bacterium]|nr:O-antigen ligase family protein [Anaerolineae bacterium]
MKQRTERMYQYVVSIIVVLVMMLAHNSTFSFDVPLMLTGLALLAALLISSKRLRDAAHLVSPLDYGWLPFTLLTGTTVLLAPFPRRSLEIWLWVTALQLPIAYGALYLFRRHVPERALYRALLIVGGYFYLLALQATLRYAADAAVAQASGLTLPGFRLFGILNHPNIFAMFIAVTTPCILSYLFLNMSRFERGGVLLWLAGATVALYGTGSRSGLIATALGLVIGLLLTLTAHPISWVTRFRAWAGAHRPQAAVFIGVASLLLIGIFGGAMALQFNRPQQDDGGGRLSYYQNAFNLFVAHPLAGGGPGGFIQNEIRLHSVPPYKPLSHAHNILLTTLAEGGLLGLTGLIALSAVSIAVCVIAWRKQPERRRLIAGPIAGLVAFACFGILDSPISQIGPFTLATVLLAFIAAGLPVPSTVSRWRVRLIAVSVWGVGVICVLVLIPYSVYWSIMNQDNRSIEDWSASAQRLDAIGAVDKTDGLILLQAAYTWSHTATLSGSQQGPTLSNAIWSLQRAIRYDPNLGMHYLNLSALYLQAGRTLEAEQAAQQAVNRSPDDPVAWLNLGIAAEINGMDQEARLAYEHVLRLEPRWSLAQFWETSPLREAAKADSDKDTSPSRQYVALIAAGNAAQIAGRRAEALAAYEQALKIAAGLSATAYVRGLIALMQDDRTAAQRWLTQATITGASDQSYVAADAWLALGDLARDRGDSAEMLRQYTAAYRYITSRGIGGYGTKGDWNYALLCFHRFGLISDYLPSLVMLDVSPEQAMRFTVLAQAMSDSGDRGGAMAIYNQILQANPNDAAAKRGLAKLLRE